MAVAANADLYADPRLNWFFKGVVPSLDGQCVSLVKWFLQEMTSVPNPQAARGDARYMGHTLVNQGYAVEVPYADRKRGDVICYEYGQYGHIGVVLSGDRTFEENVNWPGVQSKIVDGARVYASRIGSLGEGWRHDQHIYRIKSYSEGGNMEMFNDGDRKNWLNEAFVQDVGQYSDLVGKVTFKEGLEKMRNDNVFRANSGDIINEFRAFLGHDPTQADLDAMVNWQHKRTLYEKWMIQGLVPGGTQYEQTSVSLEGQPLFKKKD